MKSTTAALLLPQALSPLQELSETAVAAALKAGDIQRQQFNKGAPGEIIHPRDIKMAVDLKCEAAIVDTIRKRFPGHRIIAEEGGNLGGNGDYVWIIDPLDGTVNYFHGLPQFCTCVACCYLPYGKELPVTGAELLDCIQVGAVYAPLLDELYVGIASIGAICNGKPLVCGPQKRLAEGIVAVSFGKTDEGIDQMADLCRALARKARKLRSFGCAGLDIAQVAQKRFGGLIYRGIHIWDIAAAGIILKEAGGKLTAAVQPDGTWNMVAANAGVHHELIQLAWLS
jgi:fructose-1,6-bisphosphatase/inositol monophosphatase family enzyme